MKVDFAVSAKYRSGKLLTISKLVSKALLMVWFLILRILTGNYYVKDYVNSKVLMID